MSDEEPEPNRGVLKPKGENDLADAIRDAVGADDDETVEVVTPQFDRRDGVDVDWTPDTVDDVYGLTAMDAVVTELGDHPVRFTNVFMDDDEATEAYNNLERYLDEVAPDMNDVDAENRRRLEDVLDGFTHELEDWGRDHADTLVGTWDTSRERTHADD